MSSGGIKYDVIRQTVSKWGRGLSVPDAEMLISISEVFDIPVNKLIGENISLENPDNLKELSNKLEIINLQLAHRKESKRKFWHSLFIFLGIALVLTVIGILTMSNTYLEWDYNDPELAVLGVLIHAFVWIFIRVAPFIFTGLIVGISLTKKTNDLINLLSHF